MIASSRRQTKPEGAHPAVTLAPLTELLARSDFVSVHAKPRNDHRRDEKFEQIQSNWGSARTRGEGRAQEVNGEPLPVGLQKRRARRGRDRRPQLRLRATVGRQSRARSKRT